MIDIESPAPRRKLPVFTGVAVLIALAILISLGTWQVERLHWKEGLLADIAERRAAVPVPLADIESMAEQGGDIEYRTVTAAGRMLARIWTEADLLVAECLRQGVWQGLTAAELAAAVSVIVYESRRDSDERVSVPHGPVSDAVDATLRIWSELERDEAECRLSMTRPPDLGFVWPIYRWARGESLATVLSSVHTLDGELAAGDFVRWARQVVDLLGQIAEAASGEPAVREAARAAMAALNRGVLAFAVAT